MTTIPIRMSNKTAKDIKFLAKKNNKAISEYLEDSIQLIAESGLMKNNSLEKIQKQSKEEKIRRRDDLIFFDRRSIEEQIEKKKDLNIFLINHLNLMETYID